jgi:hypothetical protein
VTRHLPWDSAEYDGNRVITRAWGENMVWPFTVAAALVCVCAFLGGVDWPARKDKSVGKRIAWSIGLLFATLIFGFAGDVMTADLAGLKDRSLTVDQFGDYLMFGSMLTIVVSCVLRGYATYGETAKK